MKHKYLSANALKIIACVAMAIDHMGYMIFPSQKIFRIIGRIAYPIFAYFLAKGCYYTKNRLKRFLTLFIFAVVCQTGYYLFSKETKMSILVTFCISELLINFLCYFKESLANEKECGLKEEEMNQLLTPSLYIGRCPDQVTAFLEKIKPLLSGIEKQSAEIDL